MHFGATVLLRMEFLRGSKMADDKDRGKILDPSGPLPDKRKHCWVHEPTVYEVSGCPKCGGDNVTWSEYVDHCWCYDCKVDYIPMHFGIFDGPIPVALMEMLGIRLDRVNFETGKIIKFTDPEFDTTWP